MNEMPFFSFVLKSTLFDLLLYIYIYIWLSTLPHSVYHCMRNTSATCMYLCSISSLSFFQFLRTKRTMFPNFRVYSGSSTIQSTDNPLESCLSAVQWIDSVFGCLWGNPVQVNADLCNWAISKHRSNIIE